MKKTLNKFSYVALMTILALTLSSTTAYAADGDMFDFFEHMNGNPIYAYRYFSFIFTIVSLIITLAGLLILAFKVVTMACSITFLVNPPFFTMVHDVRTNLISQKGQGQGQGNSSRGHIVWCYLAYLIPDVMALSDFKDASQGSMQRTGNSSTDKWDGQIPSVGEYIKEEMISFVLISLVGAMLFSGQTQRIVANFARGGQVIAEKVATADIPGKVRTWTESGKDYVFAYPSDVKGSNQKKVASKMYESVKNFAPEDRSTTWLNSMGGKIKGYTDSFNPGKDLINNPTLTYKVYIVENGSGLSDVDAAEDQYGLMTGIKTYPLSGLTTPGKVPQNWSTAKIVVEYSAQQVTIETKK